MRIYKALLKRVFDMFFAAIVLMISSPIIILTSIFVAFSNNGKLFFLQERPGKNAKIFRVIKFKTMNDKKDNEGNLLTDDKRITPIGRFIRSASLDELPQLINILKGDMSVVGPRPLLPKYLHLYSKEQYRRHEVLPGITGWAQVNGRNNISWQKKFELDIWYVDNMSFLLDLKILLFTLKKVIKKEGVSKQGFSTTESFNGSN